MVRAVDGGIVGAGSEFAVDFQARAGGAARAGFVTLVVSYQYQSATMRDEVKSSQVTSTAEHAASGTMHTTAYRDSMCGLV